MSVESCCYARYSDFLEVSSTYSKVFNNNVYGDHK